MIPSWLHGLSIAMIWIGVACAVVIAADVIRRPQHMGIMNVVWPVAALFGTVFVLAAYFAWGRLASHRAMMEAKAAGREPPSKSLPFAVMVGKGALHCGSGCTLGDIAAEWLAFAFPAIAVALGFGSLFGEKMFAVWILDYVLAFLFGIAFQYFTIAPMRGLGLGAGIVAAVKADTLSLTAWQVGMYGFMAVAQFWIFRSLIGARLEVASPEFWFMMQIAMLAGFATSYPVNWWLLKAGIKERM